jgi:hypothetical protein
VAARAALERTTHRLVIRRRLSPHFRAAKIYTSTEGGLRYLRSSMTKVDPILSQLAAELVRPGHAVWDVGASRSLFSPATTGGCWSTRACHRVAAGRPARHHALPISGPESGPPAGWHAAPGRRRRRPPHASAHHLRSRQRERTRRTGSPRSPWIRVLRRRGVARRTTSGGSPTARCASHSSALPYS